MIAPNWRGNIAWKNQITHVLVSAGHSTNPKRDMGARSRSGRFIEGIETAKARAIFVEHLIRNGNLAGIRDIRDRIILDGDDTILAETMSAFRRLTHPRALLIDIHFNAFNGSARGTEVLVPNNPTPIEVHIADIYSDIKGAILGTPERGVFQGRDGVKTESMSARGKLGWMTLPGHNILIEAEFIDNEERMQIYERECVRVWSELAKVTIEWLKLSLS